MLRVAGDPVTLYPALPRDGFGVPFDPARHLAFVRAALGDGGFAVAGVGLPVWWADGWREKAAGWWDKGDKMRGGF